MFLKKIIEVIYDNEIWGFSIHSADLNRNSHHTHGTYENIISIKKGSRIYLHFPFLSYGRKYFKNNLLLL